MNHLISLFWSFVERLGYGFHINYVEMKHLVSRFDFVEMLMEIWGTNDENDVEFVWNLN